MADVKQTKSKEMEKLNVNSPRPKDSVLVVRCTAEGVITESHLVPKQIKAEK